MKQFELRVVRMMRLTKRSSNLMQIESAENPASEDEVEEVPDDQEELEPSLGRFKRTKARARSVIGRSY
jgi:hypothetical protein